MASSSYLTVQHLRFDMSDVTQISSEKTAEHSTTDSAPDVKFTTSTIFCDPSANVVFRTSDNVIYRVHDYYLKAARSVLIGRMIEYNTDNQ